MTRLVALCSRTLCWSWTFVTAVAVPKCSPVIATDFRKCGCAGVAANNTDSACRGREPLPKENKNKQKEEDCLTSFCAKSELFAKRFGGILLAKSEEYLSKGITSTQRIFKKKNSTRKKEGFLD